MVVIHACHDDHTESKANNFRSSESFGLFSLRGVASGLIEHGRLVISDVRFPMEP